jgi:hypothetical protein
MQRSLVIGTGIDVGMMRKPMCERDLELTWATLNIQTALSRSQWKIAPFTVLEYYVFSIRVNERPQESVPSLWRSRRIFPAHERRQNILSGGCALPSDARDNDRVFRDNEWRRLKSAHACMTYANRS